MSEPSHDGAPAEYQRRLDQRQAAFAVADRSADRWGNLRLLLVLGIIGLLIQPLFTREVVPWWVFVALIAGLVVLSKLQDRAFSRAMRFEAAVRFYRRGQARLQEKWRSLEDDGRDLTEAPAAYEGDLDLFGSASLYQLVSRCVTEVGRRTLARWLRRPAPLDEIVLRQAAIAELARNLDFRETWVMAAASNSGRPAPHQGLVEWAEALDPLPMRTGLRVMSLGLPGVLLTTFVVYLTLDRVEPLAIALVLQVAALVATRRLSEARAKLLSGPERVLSRYARLIETMESAEFEAPYLKTLQQKLTVEGRSAADRIRDLEKLVNLLDARLNVFFALSVGPATMWDLNLVLATERWQRVTGPHLAGWFAAIGDMEALLSLAALAYERPDYAYPTVQVGKPQFEAEGLHHPLIATPRVVTNDVQLGGPGSVLLLSGSNMSGKSTLLRAVGINLVLAYAGAPVAARRLTVAYMRLATSVRIVDSLAAGTSHFYAELKRLKDVVDLAQEAEPPLLYLLDEMLHGTNSRERYIGAVSVVRWLSEAQAMGIVTTHDLALAKVEDVLPAGRVTSQHFSDKVVDDQIQFDYQLRSGPVQSTNAIRLMRAVGIDVEMVEEDAHAQT